MKDPLDPVFHALSDPTRRNILSMLVEDDMAVSDLAAPFQISLAAISKHINALEDAGLISKERRGRVIWCRIIPEALSPAALWIQSLGLLEPLDLEALEDALEDIKQLNEEASP